MSCFTIAAQNSELKADLQKAIDTGEYKRWSEIHVDKLSYQSGSKIFPEARDFNSNDDYTYDRFFPIILGKEVSYGKYLVYDLNENYTGYIIDLGYHSNIKPTAAILRLMSGSVEKPNIKGLENLPRYYTTQCYWLYIP